MMLLTIVGGLAFLGICIHWFTGVNERPKLKHDWSSEDYGTEYDFIDEQNRIRKRAEELIHEKDNRSL